MTRLLNQTQRAQHFRSLHSNPPLLLPCAWDAGTARLLEGTGARSIATSSGGISRSSGYADGEEMPWAKMKERFAEISRAVSVPVTADIEHGYALDVKELKANIVAVIDAGIIGINIEDARHGALIPLDEMIARIRAVREISDRRLPEFFINVRTDVFLLNDGGEHAVKSAIDRTVAYGKAGGDGVFCPGLVERAQIETVAKSTDLPLNVMWDAALPDLQSLADIGVRRVSLGTSLAEASFSAMASAWSRISHTQDRSAIELGYATINDIMGR